MELASATAHFVAAIDVHTSATTSHIAFTPPAVFSMDDTGWDQAASAIRFRAQVTGMPRAAIRAAMTSVKPKSDPPPPKSRPKRNVCLLYTSDAADE